jgi:hypothetical protein
MLQCPISGGATTVGFPSVVRVQRTHARDPSRPASSRPCPTWPQMLTLMSP